MKIFFEYVIFYPTFFLASYVCALDVNRLLSKKNTEKAIYFRFNEIDLFS